MYAARAYPYWKVAIIIIIIEKCSSLTCPVRKSLTVHYLTDLLLVKIELLVEILCIFWFIVSFYIMYASTYGWIKMNIKRFCTQRRWPNRACFAPGGDAKHCDEHVCMSIRLSTRTSKNRHPNFIFSVHVARGRCLDILWRRCDTLCGFTSGFVDDVMLSHACALQWDWRRRLVINLLCSPAAK